MRACVIALLFIVCGGCGKGGDGQPPLASGVSALPGASGSDVIVDSWKKAGLDPSSFEAIDGKPLGDGKCRAGTIAGIDATLCEYGDDAAAKKAEQAGFSRVGDATGVSRSQGKMLLVLADRHKTDPNGRKINDVMKVFVGK
jgi:hypothetical protein